LSKLIGWIGIHSEHVDHVETHYPGIIATMGSRFGKNAFMLIDGWHRVAKSIKEGKEYFDCYELSLDESDECCLSYLLPSGKINKRYKHQTVLFR
jgi:hypothetical protein